MTKNRTDRAFFAFFAVCWLAFLVLSLVGCAQRRSQVDMSNNLNVFDRLGANVGYHARLIVVKVTMQERYPVDRQGNKIDTSCLQPQNTVRLVRWKCHFKIVEVMQQSMGDVGAFSVEEETARCCSAGDSWILVLQRRSDLRFDLIAEYPSTFSIQEVMTSIEKGIYSVEPEQTITIKSIQPTK
jgi:hypothetical protein